MIVISEKVYGVSEGGILKMYKGFGCIVPVEWKQHACDGLS